MNNAPPNQHEPPASISEVGTASRPELSIVIPVYNNGATLPSLIDRLQAVVEGIDPSVEMIFVEDGSSDDSLSILERRASLDSRIKILRLARNHGGQAALCAGFDHVQGAITVSLDADLENFPEDIPHLLAPLAHGHDLVCGVREQRKSSLLRRRLPSMLLNHYVSRQIPKPVRDIGCGMRAMRSTVIRNLEEEGEARRLLSPLLLRRARSVVEVPIRHGVSPIPSGHSFLSLLAIAVDFFMVTSRRPFLLPGISGLACASAGLVTITYGLILGLSTFSLFGFIALLGGAVLATAALVGEYTKRLYELEQRVAFYQLHPARGVHSPIRFHDDRDEPA